jgi:hypothetical protein
MSKRNHNLHLRLNEAEFETLNRLAAVMTFRNIVGDLNKAILEPERMKPH